MTPPISVGHLGSRVSALLDGQLPPAEEERAWAHVQGCRTCWSEVEREGWVKTQLVGFGLGAPAPPPPTLMSTLSASGPSSAEVRLMPGLPERRPRRHAAMVAAGGSAMSAAAVVGFLALAGPAEAPVTDRRMPATTIVRFAEPLLPVAPAQTSVTQSGVTSDQ
ncbi:zf-HC2 domain-containing protein [Nocardioides limicola]|uniref:zf-HC2 domain-containing protein n=1 Tax=Nocardioides limicola TaxID=2803368 RepID=UPI00193B9649|nr:zf-HC2 domain-containing protein [Nocardioides sp. DJM-14]